MALASQIGIVPEYGNIPAELRTPAKWLRFYLSPDPKHPEKKPRKHPVVKYATDQDKATNLRPLDHVLENLRPKEGVQRWVDAAENFIYVDLDHARNPETGEIEKWAVDLIDWLDSYTEISASGAGFHIVCRGTLPEDFPDIPPIEIYAGNKPNKLIAFTGSVHDFHYSIENRQEQVTELLHRVKNGEFSSQKKDNQPQAEILDEPQITEPDEPLPEFPRLPGALGQLVDGITHDLAYDHKALCVLTYVGLELARRFVMVPEYWLQPRFYGCMVGPPGSGKSAPDVEVRRALQEHEILTSKIELSIDSGPALVEALYGERRLILAPDELADQFEKARAGATGRNSLFGELLRLYESNETGNHTKLKRAGKEGGCIEVHDALFALIGSATTDRFERMWIGTGSVASGLQSRFVLSYSEITQPRLKTPNDDVAIESACRELKRIILGDPALNHLQGAQDSRRLRLSNAAADAIMDWRPFDDLATENARRVLDMGKRFALAVAACTGNDQVDGEAMQLGLQFADYQIALREKLFPLGDAASYVQAFEQRILAFFQKHDKTTEAVLQNSIKPEKLLGGYAAYNRAWAELLRAGKVRVLGKTHYGTAVYSLRC